jgi:hypothetical protein
VKSDFSHGRAQHHLWVIPPVAERWRTRIIVIAFAIAPLWLASNVIHFDPLAFVVIGGAIAWLVGWVISIRLRRELAAFPVGNETAGRPYF